MGLRAGRILVRCLWGVMIAGMTTWGAGMSYYSPLPGHGHPETIEEVSRILREHLRNETTWPR
jgi:hypothetical protein